MTTRKYAIDTNIILDVLGERRPFFEKSRDVLAKCQLGEIQGFITASTATDLFYLIHKKLHDIEVTYEAMELIYSILSILPVTGEDIMEAHSEHAKDFEDALLAVCAKKNGCGGIITRNGEDYYGFGLSVLSPDEI